MNSAPPASAETMDATRRAVKEMLLRSEAFRALPPAQQQEIAHNTVAVASYLAEPEGIRADKLPNASPEQKDPYAVGLADSASTTATRRGGQGGFQALGAREGAAVAGVLLREVNFPEFVTGLIDGVFHSIVTSSIKQMEAYGKLVADVAKSLNQFRDENVSVNQGREHLTDTFPDVFEMELDSGMFGEGGGPRVRVRDGVDEDEALRRVNSLPVEGGPISSLDDEAIEEKLVPAARTQLATSRQQLLATMVLMGINRIIVTDGKISAKVLYNFQASDTYRKQLARTDYAYDPNARNVTGSGEYESGSSGSERTYSRDKEGAVSSENRSGDYYSKGKYNYTSTPALTLASATQEQTDAALQTKASLAGTVEVNFKSETFPLERMADSFQIGMIQNAAQPARAVPGRGATAVQQTTTQQPATQQPATQ
jgi:hypothetical protein